MVKKLTNIFSLSGNGLRDWMVQRVTAVIAAVYLLFIIGYILSHTNLNYFDWQALFANPWMKVFSMLFLISLGLHAWIGMWTIFTDYIKSVSVRLVFHVVTLVALLAYFIWAVQILWGL